MSTLPTVAGVFGALLVVGALVAGVARRTALSLAALYLVAGFALGTSQLGVLELDPRSGFVSDLTVIALIVILFRDGLEVEGELLRTHWHVPARKLAIGMPITAAIIALAARWLVGLSWTESFLLGALLSPTDPVLSSGVVTDPRVPRLVRHSLNLESGLNDGLALAPVLALAASLGTGPFVWWRYLLENVGFGLLVGLAAGLVAAAIAPRPPTRAPAYERGLFALGVALGTYALATVLPHGNGFIAVFVAAIVVGNRAPWLRDDVASSAQNLVELVKLGVFVVFGSLLSLSALFNDGWAAVGVVVVTLFVARTVAIETALVGTGLPRAAKAFMAWFGPRGVATMTYSLLLLSQGVPDAPQLFDLAALVVVCSTIAHGLSDTPGTEWLAARVPADQA